MRTMGFPRWEVAARLVLAAVVLLPAVVARADEGMWLFNNPPRQLLEKRYGFKLTDEWLEHVMHAAVRFNSGGSGSFVSADGLVMTNHHVGADALQKLGTHGARTTSSDGFHAKTGGGDEVPPTWSSTSCRASRT